MLSTSVTLSFNTVTRTPAPPSLDFIRRLSKFYLKQPDASGMMSPIWAGVTLRFHQPLQDALVKGDVERLARLLNDIYVGDTLMGLDIGSKTDFMRPSYQAEWEDLLVRLSNCTGVLPLFNPGQPQHSTQQAWALIAAIESVLGCAIDHPGGGGQFGVQVQDRVIPFKLLESACTVAALKRLKNYGRPINRVLELGAGTGMLAYLTLKAFPEITTYATLDLPIVSVIHAYLLAHVWDEAGIWMAGEDPNPSALLEIRGIGGFSPLVDDEFGLVINRDSLPEIPPAAQLDHLRLIASVLNGYFYSMNHESSLGDQLRVFCATQKFPRLKLIQRSPYWGRSGYVEEVWQKR